MDISSIMKEEVTTWLSGQHLLWPVHDQMKIICFYLLVRRISLLTCSFTCRHQKTFRESAGAEVEIERSADHPERLVTREMNSSGEVNEPATLPSNHVYALLNIHVLNLPSAHH
jgi:hypothetical protein